jgi:hypothetical protein
MGWYYVSKLRPTTSLLFIPRLYMTMWNHGGIISAGEDPDSCTTFLWQSFQQCHLVAKLEELAKEIMNLAYEICHISKGFLTCRKTLLHGLTALLTIRRKACGRFNSSPSAGIEPAYLGCINKHASHYATEDDKMDCFSWTEQIVLLGESRGNMSSRSLLIPVN